MSFLFLSVSRHFCEHISMRTVGLIVIGNEILNGQIVDENIKIVTRALPILGLKLNRISVIPDEVDVISKEVNLFSKRFSFVLTSGGIGPTHDDVTFEGVASAFDEPLQQHPILSKIVKQFFNLPDDCSIDEPRLKLANLPKSSKLTFGYDYQTGERVPYPVISCHNVFILPGIPSLFRKGFNIIKKNLVQNDTEVYMRALYVTKDECSITSQLNEVVKHYEKSVLFGSYPVLDNNFYKVKITMESINSVDIDLAYSDLEKLIGIHNISRYDPMVFKNAIESVYEKSKSPCILGTRIKSSLETIENIFKNYKPEELLIAFTGGKDCTVLMHLIYACLKRNQKSDQIFQMIRALFIRTRPSFPEVEQFVQKSLMNYEIIPPKTNFIEYNGIMKDCMWKLKQDHPEVKAVFMGTKMKDPNGNQSVISHTTEGWPDFVLLNPILDWKYKEIWDFLITLSVPYCSLYDKGYTSVGGLDNTLPNPKLLYTDDDGQKHYYPAYKLQLEEDERLGRTISNNANTS